MDIKYNVFNINSIFLEPEAQMDKLIPQKFQHSSLAYCILVSTLRLLKNMAVTLFCVPFKYKFVGVAPYSHLYQGKILFRLPSLNNLRALNNVIERVKSKKKNVEVVDKVMEYNSYPILVMDIVSLFYLPVFWRGFLGLNQSERRIVCYNMQNYVYTPGFVWFYNRILKRYRPECVVLANDHSFTTKPLELLCEDYSIPCVYVQHASVTHAFPELHFSYSFLDGVDALKKYTSKGKKLKGKAILLGAVRYDALSKYRVERNDKKRNCIGIAINEFDDNTITNGICEEILEEFPHVYIKVRSHPAMKNHPFIFSNKERIIYTCATDETMVDYLDSIDLQISNDSGVHLDAVLGGVRTIAFNFSKYEFGDNYEYLKNGLIHLAENVDQLFQFIENENYFVVNINNVRQYDESYGKNYAGHCSDIIADFILSNSDEKIITEKYSVEEHNNAGFSYYVLPE